MISLILNNKKNLTDILNKIDIATLQKYVAGSLLAFNCIGNYIKNNYDDKQKLFQLIKLLEYHLEPLKTFISSIEILMEESFGSSIPIEGKIGIVNSLSFQIDLNKMKIGQKYLLNYKTTQFLVKKTENSDLSISEVIKK